MCLAVPFLVKAIEGQYAEVEIGDVSRNVSIILTPDVKIGEYILVHTGYSIGVVDEDEAQEMIKLFNELGIG
jgi:hydrogenase expression/formation protein HypC